jgi:hypothetical protein
MKTFAEIHHSTEIKLQLRLYFLCQSKCISAILYNCKLNLPNMNYFLSNQQSLASRNIAIIGLQCATVSSAKTGLTEDGCCCRKQTELFYFFLVVKRLCRITKTLRRHAHSGTLAQLPIMHSNSFFLFVRAVEHSSLSHHRVNTLSTHCRCNSLHFWGTFTPHAFSLDLA